MSCQVRCTKPRVYSRPGCRDMVEKRWPTQMGHSIWINFQCVRTTFLASSLQPGQRSTWASLCTTLGKTYFIHSASKRGVVTAKIFEILTSWTSCRIQHENKNHRYVHTTFSPVCLFIYDSAHTEPLSLKVIYNTTIIKIELDLEVRRQTKTDNVCGGASRHAMIGKITAQEGECTRYSPPQMSERVIFAESCTCKGSSMQSMSSGSAKTDPKLAARHLPTTSSVSEEQTGIRQQHNAEV